MRFMHKQACASVLVAFCTSKLVVHASMHAPNAHAGCILPLAVHCDGWMTKSSSHAHAGRANPCPEASVQQQNSGQALTRISDAHAESTCFFGCACLEPRASLPLTAVLPGHPSPSDPLLLLLLSPPCSPCPHPPHHSASPPKGHTQWPAPRAAHPDSPPKRTHTVAGPKSTPQEHPRPSKSTHTVAGPKGCPSRLALHPLP